VYVILDFKAKTALGTALAPLDGTKVFVALTMANVDQTTNAFANQGGLAHRARQRHAPANVTDTVSVTMANASAKLATRVRNVRLKRTLSTNHLACVNAA